MSKISLTVGNPLGWKVKIPKKCPLCGNNEIRVEHGREFITFFRNGEKIRRVSQIPEPRVWCNDMDNCQGFLSDGEWDSEDVEIARTIRR
jgi:hypothetical protein